MNIEAVVLTGGKSRRMGEDKARLLVDGVPQAARIVQALLSEGMPVTVLGQEPIEGADFLSDGSGVDGPLAALGSFSPKADSVFVASCDMPRFDVRIVRLLAERLQNEFCVPLRDASGVPLACAPVVDGFRQPFCAVYMAKAFDCLRSQPGQCGTEWLNTLNPILVSEEELALAGVLPQGARQANTREELAQIIKDAG